MFAENEEFVRKRLVREILFDLHPDFLEEDGTYITANSISIFLRTVAENKIWSDHVIRGRTQMLYSFITATDPNWNVED